MGDSWVAAAPSRMKRRGAAGASRTLFGSSNASGSRALYHCNYCQKDISSVVRIKCAACLDFDLCLECFSVGASLHPHQPDHPYKVIDNLGFPLFTPDWGADEELLLLEAVEAYGPANWADIAEHMATKDKAACAAHYTSVYLTSPTAPLPDCSRTLTKAELAVSRGAAAARATIKGPPGAETAIAPDSSPTPAATKKEEPGDAVASTPSRLGRPPGGVSAGKGHGKSASGTPAAAATPAAPGGDVAGGAGSTRGLHRPLGSGSGTVGHPHPHTPGAAAGAWGAEVTGYHAKRSEFDPEFDNDAELVLAEMDIDPGDPPEETAAKLRQLAVYNARLDERARRKAFLLQRGLLDIRRVTAREKRRTRAETSAAARLRWADRYLAGTPGAHESLVAGATAEVRLRARLAQLGEYRRRGMTTLGEAEVYEAELAAREGGGGGALGRRMVGGASVGAGAPVITALPPGGEAFPGGRAAPQPNGGGAAMGASGLGIATAARRRLSPLDVDSLPGAGLLGPKERLLCADLRLLPAQYFAAKDSLLRLAGGGEPGEGTIMGEALKTAAGPVLRMDAAKLGRLVDALTASGWLPGDTPPERDE